MTAEPRRDGSTAPEPPAFDLLLADLDALERTRGEEGWDVRIREVGTVRSVGSGVADVVGLPGVRVDEVVWFAGGASGVASDLREESIGVILLDARRDVAAGERVTRTRRVADVPVGEALLGRVVDAAGAPMDGGGDVPSDERRPIERPAPPILDRAPVETPLQTGLKVIDALFPIGRGQRELILGDRQTGKSSVALAAVLAQRNQGVRCVWCSIGQRASGVARLVATLRRSGALGYSTVVVAGSDDPPGLRWIAPFAATSIAETWMERGQDVLLVYDDLTQHARAYRELSLLLRRPPGREAYPGDVFYLHARLLERATQLRDERGGGSLTALPIIETQEQNVSAFIPTNLISITDGQIVLSPDLAARGILPAVDVGRSVSRVGGKAQRPAYRAVASPLRLAYTQFEELERFARFGADVDEDTRSKLRRGRRVREVLKQGALETMSACEQLAVLFAASEGVLDDVPVDAVADVESALRRAVRDEHHELCERVASGAPLEADDRDALRALARRVVEDATRHDDRREGDDEAGSA